VAHHLGCDSKEVSSILPAGIGAAEQAKKSFLHERGRLDQMVPALPREVMPGKSMQFRADQRQQFVPGSTVALTAIR
jgi:hypothetical protein